MPKLIPKSQLEWNVHALEKFLWDRLKIGSQEYSLDPVTVTQFEGEPIVEYFARRIRALAYFALWQSFEAFRHDLAVESRCDFIVLEHDQSGLYGNESHSDRVGGKTIGQVENQAFQAADYRYVEPGVIFGFHGTHIDALSFHLPEAFAILRSFARAELAWLFTHAPSWKNVKKV